MLKTKYMKLPLITMLVFLPFCGEEAQGPDTSGTWLIPEAEVVDGGPGRDGIPAISNPKFIPVSQISFLLESDLVVGIQIGNFIRAFPHPILDQHEIVNHTIENTSFALTYCPLTGSGIAWDTSEFTLDKTFGVSGLLYNSNLIPYDRETDSNWSQMLNLCVNGELIGKEAKPIPVVETSWETWKQLYPQSMVLSTDTGYSRNYSIYPYGDYKTSDDLLFPVSNLDSRLHKKERIHGIIAGEKTKVYPINTFDDPIEIINETFNEVQIVVAGSAEKNFAVSFKRMMSDDTLLTFKPVEGELPVIMVDDEGTKWDIFGNGISGPRAGTTLTPTSSFIAYWFAWAAFYPGAEIRSNTLFLETIHLMSTDEIIQRNQGDESFIVRRDKILRNDQRNNNFMKREFIRSRIGRRIVKEWPLIIKETRFVPNDIDGKIRGLKIRKLPENSILSDIGIYEDDVIIEINGIELNEVASLSDLFDKFKNENRFEVNIERNGNLLHLLYILK